MCNSKSSPLGPPAAVLLGDTATVGVKRTWLQPPRGSLVNDARSTTLPNGTFHGSISVENRRAAPQDTGSRRNAFSSRLLGLAQGPRSSNRYTQFQPRAASWRGSPGTPHRVTVLES